MSRERRLTKSVNDDDLMRPTADDTKRRWKRLESDLAEKLFGWVTVGSGNKSDKGDAKSYRYLGECKYRWSCDSHGFHIDLDLQWLEGIWRHASRVEKVPILALEWGDGSRAFLLPEEEVSEELDNATQPHQRLADTRYCRLPAMLAHETQWFVFQAIEVPERYWVMLPWDELSLLRIKELAIRDQIGQEHVKRSTFRGSSKFSGHRSFPARLKGSWKK